MKRYEIYLRIRELLSSNEVGETVTLNEIMSSLQFFVSDNVRYNLRRLVCEGHLIYSPGRAGNPASVFIVKRVKE